MGINKSIDKPFNQIIKNKVKYMITARVPKLLY